MVGHFVVKTTHFGCSAEKQLLEYETMAAFIPVQTTRVGTS